MAYDYSCLFDGENSHASTWRDIYDDLDSLPGNLLTILKKTIFLPHDFYDIIAAYFLLPSALCRIVPYLFLHGQSGSGKSTVAKIASYLHDVDINSSSDTFAGIRNSLNKRRQTLIEIPSNDPKFPSMYKDVERNTCMVWDDIDSTVFSNSPDLYRLFKFGYDRSTDKIILSSEKTGENLEFRCFCPKVFSSISPLHLNDRFKELKRRMIVIPCKRVEELSATRKAELGINEHTWQSGLIDISAYSWKGFNDVFEEFWDYDMAASFLTARKELAGSVRGLNSQQRAVSLDLLTTGIVSGIWDDENQAIASLKNYWQWFAKETDNNGEFNGLLAQFIKIEEANARNGGIPLEVHSSQLKAQIDIWIAKGWLLEKPRARDIKDALYDLGFKLQQGRWVKD